MAVPMIAAASSSKLDGGPGSYSYNLHYGWADHEHYSVSVRIQSGGNSASRSGWGHAQTSAIYGQHGRVYYSDGTTSSSTGY